MPSQNLDAIDRRILRELQQDGNLRNDLLANRVTLSAAPTLRRVRALEKRGVISCYVALVDPQSVGLDVRVKVDVRLVSQTRAVIDAFAETVANIPQIVECAIVAGEWDSHLTVVARDMEDYQRFVLDKLAKLPGVSTYRSTLIVREIKRTTALPV
jgi:Lrp/AsnC family leucine-responsive transcriptional regulator